MYKLLTYLLLVIVVAFISISAYRVYEAHQKPPLKRAIEQGIKNKYLTIDN